MFVSREWDVCELHIEHGTHTGYNVWMRVYVWEGGKIIRYEGDRFFVLLVPNDEILFVVVDARGGSVGKVTRRCVEVAPGNGKMRENEKKEFLRVSFVEHKYEHIMRG